MSAWLSHLCEEYEAKDSQQRHPCQTLHGRRRDLVELINKSGSAKPGNGEYNSCRDNRGDLKYYFGAKERGRQL